MPLALPTKAWAVIKGRVATVAISVAKARFISSCALHQLADVPQPIRNCRSPKWLARGDPGTRAAGTIILTWQTRQTS
jgi:hypothetical protein